MVCPPQQGFCAHQRASVCIELGLVVQTQLLCVDGVAELVFKRDALGQAGIEIGVAGSDTVTPEAGRTARGVWRAGRASEASGSWGAAVVALRDETPPPADRPDGLV